MTKEREETERYLSNSDETSDDFTHQTVKNTNGITELRPTNLFDIEALR